jgi:hypothetical protein
MRIERSHQAKSVKEGQRSSTELVEVIHKKGEVSHVVMPFESLSVEPESTFGKLSINDRFRISRTAGCPKEGVSPIFKKTEPSRVDPDDHTSNPYNCVYTEGILVKYGWLPNLICVTRVL